LFILAGLPLFLVVVAISGVEPVASPPLQRDCDSLAAAPRDDNRVGQGISFEKLDSDAAIPACENAVRDYPSVARFRFQLARALNKAERYQEAAQEYEPLAKAGYAAAAHNLATLYLNGTGVPKEPVRALELLRRAAEAGFSLSRFQLGVLYARGQYVERDLAVAAEWYQKAAEQGDANAQNELGTMFQNGAGLSQDYGKARELYRKAAIQGNAAAQFNLGMMYLRGLGVPSSVEEAAKWYGAAADRGHSWAQNDLAVMYQNGTGVPRDYNRAIELFRKSAAQKYIAAQINLGRTYSVGIGVEVNKTEAAKWFGLAAEQGNAWAQNELGDMYVSGNGVTKDNGKALELYRKAAELGDAQDKANLGWMYARGRGVAQDYVEAAKWLGLAAEQGNAWAQNELGLLYQNGNGVPQDNVKAFELYRESAAQGYAVAQVNVGWMYARGLGVEVSYTEAAKWYGLAADQGNAWAQNQLGDMYLNGNGLTKDYGKALELYRKAAERGNAQGKANLGWMYERGLGVELNYTEAAKWYGLAADQGSAWAQNQIGLLYQNGNGVPQDYAKAIELYRKSAEQGNAFGQAQLGYMYARGLGIPSDVAEAIKWYRLAADQGNAWARNELGLMYERGFGVPARDDRLKAYVWYRLAAAAGHDAALLSLGKISQSNLSDNYRESYQNGRTVSVEEKITADPFLAQHSHLAIPAAIRDRGQAVGESVMWLEKAITNGSTEALLVLAQLYLEENSSDPPDRGFYSKQTKSDRKRLGSATESAKLYEQAIVRGSNAARVNLAVLHEAGHGVERSLTAAARLYNEALGSQFDGPAQLGLLRISLKDVWEREVHRWRQAIVADEGSQPTNLDDITIEPSGDHVSIKVTDQSGHRVFGGLLYRGQQYRPPRGSNLILWIEDNAEAVRILVGSHLVTLPASIGAEPDARKRASCKGRRPSRCAVDALFSLYDIQGYGIPLDPVVLKRGGDFLIKGRNGFSEKMQKAGRIQIKGITDSDLFVHDDSYQIGFDETLHSNFRFRVPNADLTLELRSHKSYGDPTKTSSIEILVDGKHRLELSAPPDCLVTVRLDPYRLTGAHSIGTNPENCSGSKEDDAAIVRVVSRAGEPLGHIRKEPDNTVPGVIAEFIRAAWDAKFTTLRLGGQWQELLRARRIYLNRKMRSDGPNSFQTLYAALELCDVEIRLGETSAARRRLDAARETINRLGGIPADVRLKFYREFASLLTRLGRHAEAERFLLIAAVLLQRQDTADNVYRELSEVSEKLGNLDRAIAYKLELLLQDQLSSPERSDSYNSERAPAYLIELLDLLRRTGRHDWFAKLVPFSYNEAKRDTGLRALPEPFAFPLDLSGYERAWGPVDRSELIANALGLLGRTYSWMNRHEEALPLFEQQTRTFRTIFGEGSPKASTALARVANEHRLAGNSTDALALARDAFGSALRYVNSRRSLQEAPRASEDALRPPTFALLEALVVASPNENGAAEAFEAVQWLQNSKAALALQAFGERFVQSEPELQQFVRRRQDLTEQLKRLDESLLVAVANSSPSGNLTSEDDIRHKIKLTESQLEDLRSSRPGKIQQFDELAEARILPYRQLAKLLHPDEAMVTFADGEEATFVFVATREKVRSVRIGRSAEALDRMVMILRCGLDPQQWIGQDGRRRCGEATKSEARTGGGLPFDLQTAHELYQALFAPFEDMIAKKQLLIVPTGALTSLPLHVLVKKPPITARSSSLPNYRDVAWLGREHAITVLPSVGNLLSLRTAADRTHAPEPYIGFGDPLLQGNNHCGPSPSPSDCPEVKPDSVQVSDLGSAEPLEVTRKYYRGTLADVTAVRQMCPLPDTVRELRCVARSMNVQASRVVLGSASTETTVKREQLDRYRIIHFATHGLLADELRGVDEPALVLTPPDTPSFDDDGLLTASEIAQLRLNADWIVLSACNTGGGERAGAEALSGLARAFFYAGARALLISHWKVWSSAAVLLTTRAFAEMAADPQVGRAEALRRSMVAMMDDPSSPAFAHPQYWAPFTLIGEGGAVAR
jgi:TPR repeat protein/CHAT domain-containing protein